MVPTYIEKIVSIPNPSIDKYAIEKWNNNSSVKEGEIKDDEKMVLISVNPNVLNNKEFINSVNELNTNTNIFPSKKQNLLLNNFNNNVKPAAVSNKSISIVNVYNYNNLNTYILKKEDKKSKDKKPIKLFEYDNKKIDTVI